MTDRGRHARRSTLGFYRDVLLLIAGILVVGAIVFGGLSLWADRDSPTSSSSSSPTSTMTTEPTTTASTAPPTSDTPATTAPPPASSTTASVAPDTTLRAARPPGEVSLIVLNSTSTEGLAAALTEELSGLGYVTTEPTNYAPQLDETTVFHADGYSLEALAVVDAIGDGTVASDAALAEAHGVNVVVVIGLSYQG